MLEKKTKYVSVYTPSELENWEELNFHRKRVLQQWYAHLNDDDTVRDIYDNAVYNTDLIVYDYDNPYVRRELVTLNLGDEMGTYSFNMQLNMEYKNKDHDASHDDINTEIMKIINAYNHRDDIRVWIRELHPTMSSSIWKFTLAVSMSMRDCKEHTWSEYRQDFDKVVQAVHEHNCT